MLNSSPGNNEENNQENLNEQKERWATREETGASKAMVGLD